MGLYAVTGGANGIGAAIASSLAGEGHRLVVVDVADADVVADLATAEGRAAATEAIRERAPEGLDGFVPAAGIGAHHPTPSRITRVNYFGVVSLVEALEDRIASRRGAIVLVASETAFNKGYDPAYLEALARGDEEAACARIEALDPDAAGFTAYGGAKNALVRWMRHRTAALAKLGVRINAIAPGFTETALTLDAMDTRYGAAIEAFAESIPLGRRGRPEDMANGAMFLLSERASFVTGSTLHIDGGHDAVQRPDRVA